MMRCIVWVRQHQLILVLSYYKFFSLNNNNNNNICISVLLQGLNFRGSTSNVGLVIVPSRSIPFLLCPWEGCEALQSSFLYVCLSTHISQKPHVQTSQNFFYMLSVVVGQYSDAIIYIRPILWWCHVFEGCQSVGGSAERIEWNFSTSVPPLCALPPADWHPLDVSLAIHNRVCLWRQTVQCTRGWSLLSLIALFFEWVPLTSK